MKVNPKKTAQRLQKVMNVWKTLRPTKTFGGMTLEQFTGKVQPALDTRTQLNVLQNQVTESLTQRQQHDQASHDLANLVVNAVKGDPEEGATVFNFGAQSLGF